MSKFKFSLIWNTIRFLKPKQVYFFLFYKLRAKFLSKKDSLLTSYPHKAPNLQWKPRVYSPVSYDKNSFQFLNIQHQFIGQIDWNFTKYGKLWCYNLNYFDFLLQEKITKEEGLTLIKDYIKNHNFLKDGLEPYPISLRGMNWVKFLIVHKVKNEEIDQKLYTDYKCLIKNLEYHLLGNHLLENGFSLLFASYYFHEESFYKRARRILKKELNAQILKDGAHYEQAPMYHQIMLLRVLDCIHLIEQNTWKQDDLLDVLKQKAKVMLSWLQNMTYENGDIPMFNDSTYGITPSSKELFQYAEELHLSFDLIPLSDSGYRRRDEKTYSFIMDVGGIAANHQPAHTHSDIFNFEIFKQGIKMITDAGITTYEKNAIRQQERSTSSHNTVVIGKDDQTQVWGGFRVAKRARIINLEETKNSIQATHDGYTNKGYKHTREFCFGENKVVLIDTISQPTKNQAKAFFHLHSSLPKPIVNENIVSLEKENIQFSFSKNDSIEIVTYPLSEGFNKTTSAYKIIVTFDNILQSTISL